jgi:hypothetical protein
MREHNSPKPANQALFRPGHNFHPTARFTRPNSMLPARMPPEKREAVFR